jgi:transcriptional regulator with PAS, ATPase and Fis domain
LEAAEPFIQVVKAAVLGSGFITTMSDKEGYVLGVWGDKEILKMARSNNYLPGCRRTEDEVGTNAIGLSLFLREPVQVTGPEHYNVNHHPWTCSSAPIFGSDKDLLGTLTLTGKFAGAHQHTLGIVVAAAQGIENKIREQELSRERDNLSSYLDSILNSISEGIIAVDTRGRVVRVNQIAQTMLDLSHHPLVGRPLKTVVKIEPGILHEILGGEGLRDREITVHVSGRPFFFICSTAHIRQKGESLGKILVLTEKQRVYRLMHKLAGNIARFTFSDIKGRNPELRRQIRFAQIASKTDSRVLITGESGTGKELFAQAIHNESSRKNGPFVAISCASLPRELIEAELFGYQEGAFTGAKKGGRIGKFEFADRGTLFLDDIALMNLDMQAKLLRVLQANEITRLGDIGPRPVDVRVIAATSQDPLAQVLNKEFREDLYYRLNVVEISIPPLRKRMDDLETLVEHILGRLSGQLGARIPKISEEAMKTLHGYPWPGNVRELENCLEQARVICDGDLLLPEHLPVRLQGGEGIPSRGPVKTIQEGERDLILSALSRSGGNISQAARLLQISRSTLHRRLRVYGIQNTFQSSSVQ